MSHTKTGIHVAKNPKDGEVMHARTASQHPQGLPVEDAKEDAMHPSRPSSINRKVA